MAPTCEALGCGRELSFLERLWGCSRAIEHPRLAEEALAMLVDARLAVAREASKIEVDAEEVEEPAQNIEEDAEKVEEPAQNVEEDAVETKWSAQVIEGGAEEAFESAQVIERDAEEVKEPTQVIEEDAEEGLEPGEIFEQTDVENDEVNSSLINYRYAEEPTNVLKRRRSSSVESTEIPSKRQKSESEDSAADKMFTGPDLALGHPYDNYTPLNLPEGWFKGIVVPKMFDGAQCGECGEQHETFMHNDCHPTVLNYACILMDRQKEGPPPLVKCWICKTGKHHPECCGQMALYDLDTNKPLPQHLRAFVLPNPHPEVVTNFPLYYYTGITTGIQDLGGKQWPRLPADIGRLEGGIWRRSYPAQVSLNFAFDKERERQRLPRDLPGSRTKPESANGPAASPSSSRSRGRPLRSRGGPSRSRGQQSRSRGQQFASRGQSFAPRGRPFAPRGQPARARGNTRNYDARRW